MNVILDAFDAGPVLRITFRALVWPFQWLGYKGDMTMPPAPRALTALGPAYIKFGQVLSTRPDVVGDELAVQLRVLQDKLPPFSMKEAQQSLHSELGIAAETVFSSFSDPVAAASLAQVHKAHLAENGEAVAEKILRPGIEGAKADFGRLGQSLGLRGWALWRIVYLPRLRRPMGFAAGLTGALAMGDLGVITLFSRPGEGTLPLVMYQLMGTYQLEAAYGAALLLVTSSLGLFWIFDKGGRVHADV